MVIEQEKRFSYACKSDILLPVISRSFSFCSAPWRSVFLYAHAFFYRFAYVLHPKRTLRIPFLHQKRTLKGSSRLSINHIRRCRRGIMPLWLNSYRPAMPVGWSGFTQRRNHSFHFSRPSASLTVKNANSTKRQSHFVDTLKEPSKVFLPP